MKKYIIPYCFLTFIILTGAYFHVKLLKIPLLQEIDVIAVNEITEQTALRWDDPKQLHQIPFKYRIAVVDNMDSLRFTSAEELPDNLQTALRRGLLPQNIVVAGKTVGKVFIETVPSAQTAKMQKQLADTILLLFAVITILDFGFCLALHRILIRPFQKLEAYAHKITTGQFDEPLPLDRKHLFGLFTQSFDIMRDSLREAGQRQLQAERAKKELIAALNHDVKTPVTSIKLIAELLMAGNINPFLAEKLGTIESKADQINRLMDDMLHSTLAELGELQVNLASEDSSVLRYMFANAGSVYQIRMSVIPPCLVEMDVRRMEQVISNIIMNSCKYAGTDIDVDCHVFGELLRVDISDYGGGVGAEELELITTKFYRGETAKASQKEGEGMGLYIARLLMEKMGGGLEAFNRENGFTVRLWIRLS